MAYTILYDNITWSSNDDGFFFHNFEIFTNYTITFVFYDLYHNTAIYSIFIYINEAYSEQFKPTITTPSDMNTGNTTDEAGSPFFRIVILTMIIGVLYLSRYRK